MAEPAGTLQDVWPARHAVRRGFDRAVVVSRPAPRPGPAAVRPPLGAPDRAAALDLFAYRFLPGVDQTAVAAIQHAFAVTFRPIGSALSARADDGLDLALVVSGHGKLTRTSATTDQTLVQLLSPGDWFGGLAVSRTFASSVARTDAWIASASIDEVERLALQYPDLAIWFLRVVNARLRQTIARETDLAFKDVGARVATLLLDLERRHGRRLDPIVHVDHGLTQSELADAAATSRETLNKCLADFVRRGWLDVRGKSFVILDRSRLQQRAMEQPATTR